ncbi:DNA replication/repair protein RecF [soil metagenome]
MLLTKISLQYFRSYTQETFSFHPKLTVVIGPNTAGKSNLMEAIYLLATGKSFRADKDNQMVQFEQEMGRVKAKIEEDTLEVVILNKEQSATRMFQKRFLINDVPRRRVDFAGRLKAVLFTPSDLDIIVMSPSLRRNFLDDVLEQTDREYRVSLQTYVKALRQRNALLDRVRETGSRFEKQFEYWDELLIKHGTVITQKREELISFFNTAQKDVIACEVLYDHSKITPERLLQYKQAEIASATTLVGPHRDDFVVRMLSGKQMQEAKQYGSRGQQRLCILQLKLLQLSFIEHAVGERPLLLLDDIFSELDAGHIELVLRVIYQQQTIMTTTHEEFVQGNVEGEMEKLLLEK